MDSQTFIIQEVRRVRLQRTVFELHSGYDTTAV